MHSGGECDGAPHINSLSSHRVARYFELKGRREHALFAQRRPHGHVKTFGQ
jgi:hypothetical protein